MVAAEGRRDLLIISQERNSLHFLSNEVVQGDGGMALCDYGGLVIWAKRSGNPIGKAKTLPTRRKAVVQRKRDLRRYEEERTLDRAPNSWYYKYGARLVFLLVMRDLRICLTLRMDA